MRLPFRQKILNAITSTDAQSPFVSPTQLADALVTLMAELNEVLGNKAPKEWMRKEELKRHFDVSEYRVQQIFQNYNIPVEVTRAGVKRYNVAAFERYLAKAF